jgi:hypothetical protein
VPGADGDSGGASLQDRRTVRQTFVEGL